MIQKNDFVKKFELVVQQEIKNYSDSLNNILQAIRDIRIEIDSLKCGALDQKAKANNAKQDLTSQIERLTLSYITEIAKLQSQINDLSACHNALLESASIQEKVIAESARKIECNNAIIAQIFKAIEALGAGVIENSSGIKDGFDSMSYRLKNDLQKMKEEILSIPSEAIQVKKDLEEKLSTQAIDFEGVMRELLVFKKENMITQKKIENIYTLIERLQKKD